MFGEVLGLFSTAPEQKRIAALEANYDLAFARLADQQFVDFILARVVLADRLAHVDALGGRSRQRQHVLLDESVVNNDIAALISSAALMVSSSGCPGPAPTR